MLLLVIIIIFVIVDAISKPCMMTEDEGKRVQRLFCAGLLNATEDGVVEPGQPFRCSETNTTDENYFAREKLPPACISEASCLGVGFNGLISWIADNPAGGFFVFAGVYTLLTVMLIPGSVLTIGSGLAFGTAFGLGKGTAVGAAAVILGASTGATLAFLMGRYLLKEAIEIWSERFKILKALDRALEMRGFEVVLLMRLSPVIPFNVFNFVMGSTSCTLRNYVLASIIGIIPGTTAFVFIGALIGDASFENSKAGLSPSEGDVVIPSQCEDDPKERTIRVTILIVGAIATVIAVVILTIYARRQFRKLEAEFGINEEEIEKEEESEVASL